jgi:dTDP-4-amino-4,6-dideoxygalactose transaminase
MTAVLTALVDEKVGPGDGAQQLIALAKEKTGFEYCLALRSPAIALRHALKTLALENGAGVLVSPLSPVYYELVLSELGLVPVFADVSNSTACIEREKLENQPVNYKAAVIHHPLGFLADTSFFNDNGIPFIEDISSAFGSGFETPESGENPPPESFAPALPEMPQSGAAFTLLGLEERDMITAGGGALLYTFDRRRASALRNTGLLPPEYALPDMNAAMAQAQMRECAKNISRRGEIAAFYSQSVTRGRHKLFARRDAFVYNNYAFSVVLESPMKEVKQYAAKHGISVESAFENTLQGSELVKQGECPEAAGLALRTALFPIYPRLGAKSVETVAKLLRTLP